MSKGIKNIKSLRRMAKQGKNNFFVFRIGTVAVVLVACAALGLTIARAQTWSEPSQSPPQGNVAPPIWNQNAAAQTGSFWISGNGIINGNLGVGNESPTSTLDVVGTINLATSSTDSASGGVITHVGGYTIHTFLSSGTLTVTAPVTVDVLTVAGGGGGGSGAGGGGAGGVLYTTGHALSAGAKTVTVGSGGAGSTGWGGNGSYGTDSTFDGLTAVGGGRGMHAGTGGNGGSGGGGGYGTDSLGGNGTAGQGNNGGNGNADGSYPGGGGGGAGAVGGSASGAYGGAGGVGISNSITGSAVYYGGGGGGGSRAGSDTYGGAGGTGGGGAGRGVAGGTGGAGTANTGGGGGGGGSLANGGAGGTGVVIIRYLTPSPSVPVISTTSDGKVGIGTTNPNYKLDISQAGNGSTITPTISIGNTTWAIGEMARLQFLWNGHRSAEIYSYLSGNEETQIRFKTSAPTTGTLADRVTINGSGSVGIGTTSPGYPLDVNGTVNAAGGAASGVLATSTGAYGVYGTGVTAGVGGVSTSGYGVYGSSSGSYAGYFAGTLNATGAITQNGVSVCLSDGTNCQSSGGGSGLWTTQNSGTATSLYKVIYANGLFVAGGNNVIMTSPDGVTWTTYSITGNWDKISYGNSMFVAMSWTGTVRTSTDGITWTSRTGVAFNSSKNSVLAFGGGLFVAVGAESATYYSYQSSDGITWTKRGTVGGSQCYSYSSFRDITYGNGYFVVVGDCLPNGSGYNTYVFAYSPTGNTWGYNYPVGNDSMSSEVLWDGTKFIWMSSCDGTNTGACSQNANGNTILGYSTDAINWTFVNLVANYGFTGFAYGSGKYVLVDRVSATVPHDTLVSPTGLGYWSRRFSATTAGWNDVTYGNGTFVAVGAGGAIMTGEF